MSETILRNDIKKTSFKTTNAYKNHEDKNNKNKMFK